MAKARPDLTSGHIGRTILTMAVPILLANSLQSIQSLVDMVFIKYLGTVPQAAVGMAGMVVMTLATVFMGIYMATVAMVSRAVGAQDIDRAEMVAGQAMLLTGLVTIPLAVMGYHWGDGAMRALGATPAVAELGGGYLRIMFIGLFFMPGGFVMMGIFNGTGDTKTPMLLGILTTVCHIMINPILIFGLLGFPAMGVKGSALATVISQSLSFVVGMALLRRESAHVRLHLKKMLPDPAVMWRLIAIGIPGSLQMGVRNVMGLVLMNVVSQFGTAVVAAYSIGMRLQMIGLFPLFAFAGASAVMVGQNLGANRYDRSRHSAITATWMAMVSAAVVAAGFTVLAGPIMRLFARDAEVVGCGAYMLVIISVSLLPVAVGIVLGRSMGGAGDTVSPLVITLGVLVGFQIPAAVYMAGVPTIFGLPVPLRGFFAPVSLHGATGVWWSILIASMLQAIVTAVWFSTGNWRHKKA